MVWDLTVVGCDVLYKEEFIPDDEGLKGHTRFYSKIRKDCMERV